MLVGSLGCLQAGGQHRLHVSRMRSRRLHSTDQACGAQIREKSR
jgi:hypothetical protein